MRALADLRRRQYRDTTAAAALPAAEVSAAAKFAAMRNVANVLMFEVLLRTMVTLQSLNY